MDEVKVYLKQQQKDLLDRIESIKQDFMRGRSADWSEQTTENENNEVLVRLKSDAEIELRAVNHALARIDNEEYGICETCQNPINPERLKAVPHASECINCAN